MRFHHYSIPEVLLVTKNILHIQVTVWALASRLLVLQASLSTKRKGLERRHYSSCSLECNLHRHACVSLHALRFAVTHYPLHIGCTQCTQCLCARWARLWFTLAYRGHAAATKFAYSYSSGFLGKRTTQVTASYQTLPLCEGAALQDYLTPESNAFTYVLLVPYVYNI